MPDSQPLKATPAPAAVSKPDVTRAASIFGLFGATGTGKSTIIKRTLAARPPGRSVIVFDAGHEYADGEIHQDEAEFLTRCGQPGVMIFRPAFDADLRARQFDRFCAAGLAIARSRGDCLIVVEELHRVTGSSWAPQYWRELIETGRKFGASVIATAQRPAAIDKGFWSNCTTVRSGRLNYIDDQRTLAAVLGVTIEQLGQLAGQDYIERDLLAGTPAKAGKLTF